MIPNKVLVTTLKHLHSKKSNYYRSIGMDPDNSEKYTYEIDQLTESIDFFEGVRSDQNAG
jgi:hypothetical protein